ncbi:MAG: hypothetical protein H0T51_24705 [Pirellulales bacterium]|nr:hypothetical protein [Pirellulales bacterium]
MADDELQFQTVGSYEPLPPDAQISAAVGATHTSSAPLEREPMVTGLLVDADEAPVRSVVAAARRVQNLSERLIKLSIDAFPSQAECLESFDQVVLATDQLADDPVGLAAIRQWVASGGRLWVMLDRVSTRSLPALMGDEFGITIVGRTSMAEIEINDIRDVPRKSHGVKRSFSRPLELVQVVTDAENDVAFQIERWPAAFWQKVGRGRVLFTTVGEEAWIAHSETNVTGNPATQSTPLQALASEFFQPHAPALNLPQDAERHAASLVGHSIISRNATFVMLGTCGTAAVALTFLSFRWRRPAHFAWMAALLAFCTSGALVVVGGATRRSAAPTLVSMQLIDVMPSQGELSVSSIVGSYRPNESVQDIEGFGCSLLADAPLLQQSGARMVWTDDQRWRLERASLPSGFSLQRCSWRRPIVREASMTTTLTPLGIEGTLTGPYFATIENAIIAAPSKPWLAVKVDDEGVFRAGSKERLEHDQFASTQLLNDQTNRRQKILRSLVAAEKGEPSLRLNGPTLLFWTKPLEAPVAFGLTEQVGDALVVMPISITRPAPGSKVAIPALLLPFEAVEGNDGTPVTSAYSNASRAWVDALVAATQITLRFQAPPTLLPLSIKRVTLHVEIAAPSRTVAIAGWNARQLLTVKTVDSPVGGRLQAAITDPQMLQLDDRGGLLLNINVGPHPREATAALAEVGWNVKRVWLDVDEAVIERHP